MQKFGAIDQAPEDVLKGLGPVIHFFYKLLASGELALARFAAEDPQVQFLNQRRIVVNRGQLAGEHRVACAAKSPGDKRGIHHGQRLRYRALDFIAARAWIVAEGGRELPPRPGET